MNDRRLTPANRRVAATYLRGEVLADRYVDGEAASVAVPVLDLLDAPDGRRERQLLLGAGLMVYERRAGWAFVQAHNGYVGYVRAENLGVGTGTTHRVATPATHVYEAEDFKSPDRFRLPFGAQLRVLDERAKFFEAELGFVPKKHLRALDRPFFDPATVAQLHFGTPYLWGGNSTLGIDCSGLVFAALDACGIPCPGDADLQEAALGQELSPDAPFARGDLLFWRGHVGMMVDDATLIHANAHHMAVVYEDANQAIMRIETQGDGPVTRRKRL